MPSMEYIYKDVSKWSLKTSNKLVFWIQLYGVNALSAFLLLLCFTVVKIFHLKDYHSILSYMWKLIKNLTSNM